MNATLKYFTARFQELRTELADIQQELKDLQEREQELQQIITALTKAQPPLDEEISKASEASRDQTSHDLALASRPLDTQGPADSANRLLDSANKAPASCDQAESPPPFNYDESPFGHFSPDSTRIS